MKKNILQGCREMSAIHAKKRFMEVELELTERESNICRKPTN